MNLEQAQQKFDQLQAQAEQAKRLRDQILRDERAAGASYYSLSKRTGLTEMGVKWICKQEPK